MIPAPIHQEANEMTGIELAKIFREEVPRPTNVQGDSWGVDATTEDIFFSLHCEPRVTLVLSLGVHCGMRKTHKVLTSAWRATAAPPRVQMLHRNSNPCPTSSAHSRWHSSGPLARQYHSPRNHDKPRSPGLHPGGIQDNSPGSRSASDEHPGTPDL